MSVTCYAAKSVKSRLESFEYQPEPLGPHDVEVEITHCGICHSDIHLIDNDWGITNYPLVPGHEIAGTLIGLGSEVQAFEKGQRVGIGWQRSSCLQCEYCIQGLENLCPKIKDTCVGHHGGFAEKIRADSRFAFPLPEELDSENAAPLLCAGVTVYSALVHCGVLPAMRVGVIGVGGLGHLAVQFARAMGCEVTAFSSRPEKEREARELGAHHFVPDTDLATLEKLATTQDFLLSTVPVDLDWKSYLDTLRPGGKLCFVGVPGKPLEIPVFSLIVGRNSICGSPIGSRTDIKEMLAFAARHQIQAWTESFPMSAVNEGIDRVRNNQARYRVVLTN
ncbi:MAG: NAD(P)-dependent alcohol dehydrogenase [Nitrospinaceae bacterium]